MSLQSVDQICLDFLPSLPIRFEVSPALLSSDAGLLPVRQFDEVIGFTERFAKALGDTRDGSWVKQGNLVMVRQRIYGIIAGYEDQNDHDTLRSDPVFKLIADRLPDDGDLASQPTLSRFENGVTISDLWRLRDVLIEEFIASFDTPPTHLRSTWIRSTTRHTGNNNWSCITVTTSSINICRSRSHVRKTTPWC
jgi:hypothetical protein